MATHRKTESKRRKDRRPVPTAPSAATEKAPESRPGSLRENFGALLGTAVLAVFFTTFLAQAYEIPSVSMENTLLVGDRPFVNKVSFAPRTGWLGSLLPYEQIRRGDIVVFRHPAEADRKN